LFVFFFRVRNIGQKQSINQIQNRATPGLWTSMHQERNIVEGEGKKKADHISTVPRARLVCTYRQDCQPHLRPPAPPAEPPPQYHYITLPRPTAPPPSVDRDGVDPLLATHDASGGTHFGGPPSGQAAGVHVRSAVGFARVDVRLVAGDEFAEADGTLALERFPRDFRGTGRRRRRRRQRRGQRQRQRDRCWTWRWRRTSPPRSPVASRGVVLSARGAGAGWTRGNVAGSIFAWTRSSTAGWPRGRLVLAGAEQRLSRPTYRDDFDRRVARLTVAVRRDLDHLHPLALASLRHLWRCGCCVCLFGGGGM